MSERQNSSHGGISAEKKQIYFDRRRVDLESLRTYLADQRFDDIYTIAHKMKGNARLFDFEILEPIALELEKASRSQNNTLVAEAIAKFEAILNSLGN